MRYFVLCVSDGEGVSPHIVAEVVGDILDTADDRESTLAGAIAGPRSIIATRSELLAHPAGREALEAWDSHDDTEFERETTAILGGGDNAAAVQLRVVGDNEPPRPHPLPLAEDVERMRVIWQSRGLRILARAMTQEARALRAEIAARRSGRALRIVEPEPDD